MLLYHNPPQESGSTSPFSSLANNEPERTLARASVYCSSCSSTLHLLDGPGLEQRRLTSQLSIPRTKKSQGVAATAHMC